MTRTKTPSSAGSFSLSFEYLSTVLLSWLVPGAGHWLLGWRVRSILLGTCILGFFWVGESVLAENMAVSREVSPWFFGLQAGNGLSTFAANHFWGTPRRPGNYLDSIDRDLSPNQNLGVLLTLISGLLNLLLVFHIMDPRSWEEAQAEQRVGKAAPGSP